MSDLVSKYNWVKREIEVGTYYSFHFGEHDAIQLFNGHDMKEWHVRICYGIDCYMVNEIEPNEDVNELVKTVEEWYEENILKSHTKRHCCERMTEHLDFECDQHDDPFECPDQLIFYSDKMDEYGMIIHDGGPSYVPISFCPWCGTKLPESKNDLWFETLEDMGFDDPFSQEIPEEFHSDKWYRDKDLKPNKFTSINKFENYPDYSPPSIFNAWIEVFEDTTLFAVKTDSPDTYWLAPNDIKNVERTEIQIKKETPYFLMMKSEPGFVLLNQEIDYINKAESLTDLIYRVGEKCALLRIKMPV